MRTTPETNTPPRVAATTGAPQDLDAAPAAPAGERLTRWAVLNAVLHLCGLILAAVTLRPGSPLVPLDDRLAYLARMPLGWTIGWLVWAACAVALVVFLALLRTGQRRATGSVAPVAPRAATLGVVLASLGAAIDLTCDAAQVLVLPVLARARAIDFQAVEQWLLLGGVVAANGLYSCDRGRLAYSFRVAPLSRLGPLPDDRRSHRLDATRRSRSQLELRA